MICIVVNPVIWILACIKIGSTRVLKFVTNPVCVSVFDECISSPCKNSGTCYDLLNDYRCECIPGWEGKNCEIPTNECDSLPCQNGGTCVDLDNAYRCECPQGFSGFLCEISEWSI